MNSEELAKAVATELLSGSSVWLFLLITALFASVGAYFGKYLGTKGTNLATKEDFIALQAQLGASTRLVESVKSEIARTDWVAREWATLRIKKLEELMTILHACDVYLDAKRVASADGRFHPDTPPFDQAIIVSELYLPELFDAVNLYILKCREIFMAMNKQVLQDIENKKTSNLSASSLAWGDFYANNGYSEMLSIAKKIREDAKLLLQKIILGRMSG